MKKLLLILAILPFLLSSCGGSGVRPADPAITYSKASNEYWKIVPLNDCLKLSKCAVAPFSDGRRIMATATIEVVETPNWPKDVSDYAGSGKIELLDENQASIGTCNMVFGAWMGNENGLKSLVDAQKGEVIVLKGPLMKENSHDEYVFFDKKGADEFVKKVKYMRIADLSIIYKVENKI